MIEEGIVSAVSVVGFPIVSFFAMFYLCDKTIAKNTEALNKLENALLKRGSGVD